jgi:hypothetical protein
MKEKVTKPDIVIKLTDEQLERTNRLHNKQQILNSGLILGSLSTDGKYIALSYHPQHIGEQIRDFAYEHFGEGEELDGINLQHSEAI